MEAGLTPEGRDGASPAGEDEPEPGREEVEISQEEGGHGVSVVRLVLFRLTQTVQEDEREAGVRERGERPEDGLAEDGGWLGGTLAGGEEREEGGVRLEVGLVGRQPGRLAQLGRQGVEELRQEAGGGVVRLTEVVGHHSLPRLALTTLRPEAAGLDEGEDECSLAGARSSLYTDVTRGLEDVLHHPLPPHQLRPRPLGNLEIQRPQGSQGLQGLRLGERNIAVTGSQAGLLAGVHQTLPVRNVMRFPATELGLGLSP